MQIDKLLTRALNLEFLSIEEGVFLFENAALTDLMFTANEIRKLKKGDTKVVTWQIDRNANQATLIEAWLDDLAAATTAC